MLVRCPCTVWVNPRQTPERFANYCLPRVPFATGTPFRESRDQAYGMSTPQIRTLKRALEKLQTIERLATALEVSVEELQAYLVGRKPVPNKVFLEALDIVAERRRR